MATIHPEHLSKLLVSEIFNSRKIVVGVFVFVVLSLPMIGLVWPKGYVASTTILAEEKNIIQPLMQGAAISTDVADRSLLARETIFSRKVMTQLLADTGLLREGSSPEEQDKLFKKLMKQTSVNNVSRSIIKIEYRDEDPERAFLTTKRYAELFIEEALGNKATESQAAFDFIENQVQEYHNKLVQAEDQLKEFRSSNADALPGSDTDISTRLSAQQARIEQAMQELSEAEIKKTSLEKQLSGEAEVATTLSREGQYRARIAELQSQIDTLRLSYHDTYPDIVRLRHQINDLNESIATDRKQREAAKASGRVVVDDSVINNPMYQQLKHDLSQTQINIDTLNARIAEAKHQMNSALERGKRVLGGEATLAELTRDYQVNRDIYQDLLKRRENARVSMNMDRERQGLTFRIQEPATLPLNPNGLLFKHFIVAALVLGVLIPIALVYAKLELDPRIRIGSVVTERYKLPLLAVVPRLWPPIEVQATRRELQWLSLIIMGALLIMALIATLHTHRVI
jgi:polysaccharide chain length determinant protein (PEP-CTERM system associated)